MKYRNVIFKYIMGFLLISLYVFVPTKVEAVDKSPVYFGANIIRENNISNKQNINNNNEKIGYILKNNTKLSKKNNSYIWNVVKYDNIESKIGKEGNYYYLKNVNNSKINNYTNYLDLTFINKKELSNKCNYIDEISDENYNCLLSLLDLFYLDDNDESKVDEYLNKIYEKNNKKISNYTYKINYSDIKAIQQSTIWYFSYKDSLRQSEWDGLYNNIDKKSWLMYTEDGLKSKDFVDNKEKEEKDEQFNILYKYLITEAKTNAKKENKLLNTNIKIYTNIINDINCNPVIWIEKKPETKNFDLALRTYITKVDGILLENENSRVPKINIDKLEEDTTAEYLHKKEPVVVKSGSTITYTISVYNEGEKEARVNSIEGILSDGLKFSKINTSGFNVDYNEENNTYIITREKDNTKTLYARSEKNLQSENIEIECLVTAKPESVNKKILNNIVHITETYDPIEEVVVKEGKKLDIDSSPSNMNTTIDESYKGNINNKDDLSDSNYYYKGQEDDDDFEKVVIKPASFDLKLINRIYEINGEKVPERFEGADIKNLASAIDTTATYQVDKKPLVVKKGDIVKYTFRVYNEGDIEGYASEITDYIPEEMEFVWSEKTDDELENDLDLSDQEKKAIKYNQMVWDIKNINKENNKVDTVSTDYLSKDKGSELIGEATNLLKAFDYRKQYKNTINDKNPDYKEISIYLKVITDSIANVNIVNNAAITGCTDSEGDLIQDRDSNIDEYVKYEDDEDYDNVVLRNFDLALREFIIAKGTSENLKESDYIFDSEGIYERAPDVDTSELALDLEQKSKTAKYNHKKDPIEVYEGEYIIYNIRVYNEGDIDGYASEITSYIPEELEFVNNSFNKKYGWKVQDNNRIIKSSYLDNFLIDKIDYDSNDNAILSYKDVQLMLKVKNGVKGIITNISEISVTKDNNKKNINDRDSQINNIQIPEDNNLSNYKSKEKDKYIEGQEDDDDFEKVLVKKFDLALREFVSKVNNTNISERTPKVRFNTETNNLYYEHTKEPLSVEVSDEVVYTIRVYNEGDIDGFASEIIDENSKGLIYLPDNEINTKYKWIMYDEDNNITEDVTKLKYIKTNYLSPNQNEDGSINSDDKSLLKGYTNIADIEKANPKYVDIKIVFKVGDVEEGNKIFDNKVKINKTVDSKGDPILDFDSSDDINNYEDDSNDSEYVKLNSFGLETNKWISQIIINDNGKEKISQTGYKYEKNPSEVVKVNLEDKNINSSIIKFKYTIKIDNNGNTRGKIGDIIQNVPEGLKFVKSDNPDWKYDESGNIIYKKLSDIMLEPGETEKIEVVLTWINGDNRFKFKTYSKKKNFILLFIICIVSIVIVILLAHKKYYKKGFGVKKYKGKIDLARKKAENMKKYNSNNKEKNSCKKNRNDLKTKKNKKNKE